MVLLASLSLVPGLRVLISVGRLACNPKGGSDPLQVRKPRVIFQCISEALSNPVREIASSSRITTIGKQGSIGLCDFSHPCDAIFSTYVQNWPAHFVNEPVVAGQNATVR